MTIEQVVKVPESGQITITVPPAMANGEVRVSLSAEPAKKPNAAPFLSFRGSCKDVDTMEAYFERKRREK